MNMCANIATACVDAGVACVDTACDIACATVGDICEKLRDMNGYFNP
jgi:hypothetical protein